ncbi:hypothetical protein REPUB_Repub08aG0031700 [Reevesia pubescens]
MAMVMTSPNESPKRCYPSPDKKVAGSGGRLLRPERNPRFAFNVPPCSPSFRYQDRPLNPPPMFPNTLPPKQRRRTTPTTTSSSHDKTRTFLIGSIVFFSILAMIGIPVMVFYVFGPHSPTFSVEKVTLHNPIFYKSPTSFSSLINITMKVNNPARHIGIFYEYDNSIVATYSGIRLCSGGIPPFFQPPKDELFLQSPLTGLGVVLPDDLKQKLKNNARNRRIPLALNMMGMVRFKMGSVTSRALLKVSCEIVLDNLNTYTPKLISSSCGSTAGFWFATIRN